MRTLAVVTILIGMAAPAAAQPTYFSSKARHETADLDRAARRYIEAMAMRNEGVVESALAHAVVMKFCCPDHSFTGLQASINSLAVTSDSPSIRYRAYLAGLVFDSPELFAGEEQRNFEGTDELFQALAARVNIALLNHSDRKFVRPE